jgi:hypothetical protein
MTRVSKKIKELNGAVMNTNKIKNLLCSELRKYIDYFRHNNIMMTIQRIPGTNKDSYRELMEDGFLLSAHKLDFDEEDREGLFGIQHGEKMDTRHLVLFAAKATNTRIVLLHYWRKEATFTCCDIDY